MAINTGGFRVSQMPVYTPPSPGLVAFNPSSITQGVGQTFSLANLLEQIQAQRELRDEQAQTRTGRISAVNMANQAKVAQLGEELGLYKPRAELELGQIGKSQRLLTPQENAETAALAFQTAQNTGGLKGLSLQQQLNEKRLGGDLSMFEDEMDVRFVDTLHKKKAAEAAVRDLDESFDIHDNVWKLKRAELEDKLEFAKSDNQVRRALEAAKVDLAKAQAEYARGLGRQTGTPKTDAQRISEIEKNLETLNKLKVSDGRTFGAYKTEAYRPNGTFKEGLIFKNDKDAKGEQFMIQEKALMKELERLTGRLPSATQTDTAAVSPQDAEALEWVSNPANRSNPSYNAILTKLKTKGLIK